MKKKFFLISMICSLTSWGYVSAQSNPTAHFAMDACDLDDSQGRYAGLAFLPTCACGVSSNGLSFNGTSSRGSFEQPLTDIFLGDWSMSFYLLLSQDLDDVTDILYVGTSCQLDSVLSFRYFPLTKRFRFILSNSPNNNVLVDGLAQDDRCWQYIAIVKQGATVQMYINGVLSGSDAAISDLSLDIDAMLSISDSPCQDNPITPDIPFRGVIDELRIYDRSLTAREVERGDLMPDQIITRDTTIFLGDQIKIRTGGTCSDDFTWSPTTYLSNPTSIEPTATPDENITYTLTVNGEACSSIDQVTIRVADATNLTCADLLLPNAFTPNNDLVNDVFGISNRFIIESLRSFEIYNRWGGRVFFTDAATGAWDGTYKGQPAPAASYLYKVAYICDGQSYDKTGTVHLIR